MPLLQQKRSFLMSNLYPKPHHKRKKPRTTNEAKPLRPSSLHLQSIQTQIRNIKHPNPYRNVFRRTPQIPNKPNKTSQIKIYRHFPRTSPF